ncbi:hypothetical protein CVT24_007000 [Panaeolus cyanescens]|uniref:Mob1/phocein n=1 Tax=Panaeolus cyanescens TaxID=181874 RepID=A0A409YKF6_9AGAR|nr:hypothetical protein CVT24_007000 [Panaeolus cyanescens]
MSFFNSIGRSMTRGAQRTSKRATTPTSATFSPTEMPPPAVIPRSPTTPTIPKPLYLSSPFVEAALVKGNFKTIVMLPKYVDIHEWVAVNIFDFYTNLNEFYGVVTECCTQQSCPTMSAGQTLNYTWINGERKQVQLPAPTYIDYVMTWVQNLLNDENTFPTKAGQRPEQIFDLKKPPNIFGVSQVMTFPHLSQQPSNMYTDNFFEYLLTYITHISTSCCICDMKDVKGAPSAPVGIGQLWERWKEMGILEG